MITEIIPTRERLTLLAAIDAGQVHDGDGHTWCGGAEIDLAMVDLVVAGWVRSSPTGRWRLTPTGVDVRGGR